MFDVRKGTPDPEAVALSGGNLQKFVVGREFDRKPGVLIVCQPTWGVDAGAATTIRQALIDLARSGSAVLVISQDLDEILEISDRVAVISKGPAQLRRATPAHDITREEIGLLMGGGQHDDPKAEAPVIGGKSRLMRIELIRRPERSRALALLSPLIAVVLTVLAGFVMFALLRVDPLRALYSYFIAPLTDEGSIEDLLVRASPLILIGVGLTFCFRANVWNIGAEGQMCMGAIAGATIPVLLPTWQGPLVLPLMMLLGVLGGMAYGAIPALLKNRFGTSEILVSLMLVYVAQLIARVGWRAGRRRNPAGRNFPNSRLFDGSEVLPVIAGDHVRLNLVFAIVAAVVAAVVLRWTLMGFEISVAGQAPRARCLRVVSQPEAAGSLDVS